MQDIIGKRYGILTVEAKSDKKAKSGSMYICRCDCGAVVTTARCGLISGHTKSCGCLRKSYLRQTRPSTTHGHSRERLYKIWCGMKERCNNANNIRFEIYGGRGIKVCSEWSNNYEKFRNWATNSGYNPKAQRGECTIDRINSDGNYEPKNCRWVDMHEQRINQRRMKNE